MKVLKFIVKTLLAGLPVAITIVYGLIVSSPAGEAARESRLVVRPDQRVEIAALLARCAGRDDARWPPGVDVPASVREIAKNGNDPALVRLRGWSERGFTS